LAAVFTFRALASWAAVGFLTGPPRALAFAAAPLIAVEVAVLAVLAGVAMTLDFPAFARRFVASDLMIDVPLFFWNWLVPTFALAALTRARRVVGSALAMSLRALLPWALVLDPRRTA